MEFGDVLKPERSVVRWPEHSACMPLGPPIGSRDKANIFLWYIACDPR